jgi:hypothetical protein
MISLLCMVYIWDRVETNGKALTVGRNRNQERKSNVYTFCNFSRFQLLYTISSLITALPEHADNTMP